MRRTHALLCLALPGCALLTKADVVPTRHFSLESLSAASAPASANTPSPAGAGMRLGRVTGPPFLEDRPTWRRGAFEVGVRGDLRWTEPPTEVLRRHLARALFETHGLVQRVDRDSPTLEVELIAFEARPEPPAHARVVVSARVVDRARVLWSGTLMAQRAYDTPVGGDEATALVGALAAALDLVVEDLAGYVEQTLVSVP
jgi:ABC-type uncharacterized transport system auxiliary subunit